MQRLSASVQTYAWGVKGRHSRVAQLKAANDEEFVVDEDTSYAELWIGSHHALPATLHRSSGSSASLHDHLGHTLPFMIKVMSVGHSLSLQIHPTRTQAALLHTRDPVNYPDDNHKREMVYALKEFRLLIGWRPIEEIREKVNDFPQLTSILGGQEMLNELYLGDKGALRECVRHWLDESRKDEHLVIIQQIAENIKAAPCLLSTPALFLQIHTQFPDDVGCIAAFMLNQLVLTDGQCCYYDNQVPHAYLSGDCIECVSTSNNTIRAAMTPKHRDFNSFVDMVNLETTAGDKYIVEGVPMGKHVIEFDPHCDDFALRRLSLTNGTHDLPVHSQPCLLIVTEGEATFNSTLYSRGGVLLIESNTRVTVACKTHVQAFITFQP